MTKRRQKGRPDGWTPKEKRQCPVCGAHHANAVYCSRECAGVGNTNGANTQKHPRWCTCEDCKPG